jgi:Tol biopolymer transport system component
MSLDGTQQNLTKWPANTYPVDPAMSPDGKHLAFGLELPATKLPDGSSDFGSDLYVADANGKNPNQIVKHEDVAEFIQNPAWLTNSTLIFTVRGRTAGGRADFRIEKVGIDGGQRTRFVDGGVDPAVSRDGKEIVWDQIDLATQAETLTIASADLQNKKVLASQADKITLFGSKAFSPDGTRIAFTAVDFSSISGGGSLPLGHAGASYSLVHPYAQDVWIVNSDGTGLHRLAEIAENMPSLAWSGDGSTIYALGPSAFWRIDAAAGTADQVGLGMAPAQIAWLPGS